MKQKKKPEATAPVKQQDVFLLATEALEKLRAVRIELPIRVRLTTPLLMQRWTDKAVRELLGRQTGHDEPRLKKDLESDFLSSPYRNVNGAVCVPCRNVKSAIEDGTVLTGKMVSAASIKRSLRVQGNASPIVIGGKHITDIKLLQADYRFVRLPSGAPDLRARALVPAGAYFDVVLSFAPSGELSVDKAIAAFRGAGSGIGIGEYRPARGGEFGQFDLEILSPKDVKRITEENAVPEESFQIPEWLLRAVDADTRPKSDPVRKVLALADEAKRARSRKAG